MVAGKHVGMEGSTLAWCPMAGTRMEESGIGLREERG